MHDITCVARARNREAGQRVLAPASAVLVLDGQTNSYHATVHFQNHTAQAVCVNRVDFGHDYDSPFWSVSVAHDVIVGPGDNLTIEADLSPADTLFHVWTSTGKGPTPEEIDAARGSLIKIAEDLARRQVITEDPRKQISNRRRRRPLRAATY